MMTLAAFISCRLLPGMQRYLVAAMEHKMATYTVGSKTNNTTLQKNHKIQSPWNEEMRSYLRLLYTKLAAELSTNCNRSRRRLKTPE